MKAPILIVFFFMFSFVQAQNLVVNPGAEVNPTLVGWTLVSCHWINGSERTPHGGDYHFYAGGANATSCELYQDINVSAFAASIDGGASTFDFSSWMRSYRLEFSGYNDLGRVVVEYRDASSAVLSTYDTGFQGSTSWMQYADTRVAPAGTRTIRIRLLSDATINSDSDGYFDDISLTHTSTLPVTLLSFESTIVGSAIAVNWQTAKEESNDFFTIEKSPDGVHWEIIAVKKGALTTDQLTHYQLMDEEPVHGIQYYRLKQTDVNGATTTYPIIVQAFHTTEEELLLFPNPSFGQVNVQVTDSGVKTLRVLSSAGREVLTESTFETNDYFLDLSELPRGYYVIEVHTLQSVKRKTLVIQ